MHSIEDHKKKKLERLMDNLGLSPNNRTLALAYLTSEPRDDSLLQKAEAQNFRDLDWENRHAAVAFLEPLRQSGGAELERFVRLYWAIGKSTAIFVLQHESEWRRREGERENRAAILGKSAAAAMEAERCAWRMPDCGDLAWLYQLAAEEPQVLEEAQALSGTSFGNMRILLAGILLCKGKREAPGLLQRLKGGRDPLAARQIAILEKSLLGCLNAAASQLSQADRDALAAYMQKGQTDLQLPLLSVPTAYGQTAEKVLATEHSEAYLTALMGTAAFQAQGESARARCAVRVFLSLNPTALLTALFRALPREYLTGQLDTLLKDLPDGEVTMLLFLSRFTQGQDGGLLQTVARRCRGGASQALALVNAREYEVLAELLPGAVSKGSASQREKIADLLAKKVQTGKEELRDFVTDTGSLKSDEGRLAAVTAASYAYPYQEVRLVSQYQAAAGWDDFVCRCAVVFALVFRAEGMSQLFPQTEEAAGLADALLARDLPLDRMLQIFGAVYDSCYGEEKKAEIRNAVYGVVKKPEYLEALETAAVSGGVFGRYVALSALDDLAGLPGCGEKAKAAILAATADSSKQIQELLLAILTSHPDWAGDIAALLKSKKAAQRLMAAAAGAKLGEVLRPALEAALAAEKSTKVAEALRAALGQEAAGKAEEETAPADPDQLAAQVLKGGKKRRIQWLLDMPLPALHLENGGEAGEDRRAALLAAYCELGRIGRSETAARLAQGIDRDDLASLANEVYEAWLTAGAQSKTKWVLAFAAAFGGPAMTPKLTRAINDWPQHARGAIACDAVAALTLSDDPAALLTVDAISRKFKFRQVKAAAAAALEHAAEELGITPEELADRIVPDLGFSADGRRIFDYGPRSFTVRLTPTMELEITNDSGKTVKNLPAPGKTDDEEKANAAYSEFKTMKKQMRTTVTAQKNRLEAALASLRCWSGEAWQALFVKNPIMHQFAMSLIWGVYQGDRLQTTFRYMEDGSFNTVDEEEYQLPEGARIGIVHPVELTGETLAAWKQQLEDYEIVQSIPQLDRPVYSLEPGTEQSRSLEKFGGKQLNGLSLSGKLLGLGWYRGSVQDGGGFYTFYREDPALGMGVELNFSGSFVGGENDTVTVYDAVFYRAGTVARGSYCYDTPKEEDIFALGDVPARYYSEVVYQLERATASSTETDPDWRSGRN